MEKKGIGWGWIIFLLIICWPVGLFLLIKKLATDKSALMSGKTRPISAAGWILVVIGALTSVSADPSSGGVDTGVLVFGLAMTVGGVLVLIKASRTKRTAARYKKYIDLAINQNVRGIDNIAAII